MAAKAAADATRELTSLEAARRHDELTPEFTVTVAPFNPGDTQNYRLTIGLDGPVALVRLHSITVEVRDDRPGRDQEASGGGEVTAEAVRAHVWSPLRFSPRLGPSWAQADDTGRSVRVSRPLVVGEGISFQLERTQPPPWYRHFTSSDQMWRRDIGGLLRLSVVAAAEATGTPWTLPLEIDLTAQLEEGSTSPA
jgi:hypothetical protein